MMQARNLIGALAKLPAEERLLVWCGNNHHTKVRVPSASGEPDSSWELMGYHFREQSGLDPFVIDQGSTVLFLGMSRRPTLEQWLEEIAPTLLKMGGTAGFLSNEAPSCLAGAPGNDAEVVSLDNEMLEWDPSEHQETGVLFFQKHEGMVSSVQKPPEESVITGKYHLSGVHQV